MAVYADRVKETTTTTGTGTYSLAGAEPGFQTFVAGATTGSTVTYVVENGTDWEVGEGVITDGSPDTLTRASIIASSNAGAAVDWAAGTKNAFLTLSGARVVTTDKVNTLTEQTLVPDGTISAPSIGFSADTDVGIYRPAANTLAVGAGTGSTVPALLVTGQNGCTNGITIAGNNGGFPDVIANGNDTNIPLGIFAKGNGTVVLGSGNGSTRNLTVAGAGGQHVNINNGSGFTDVEIVASSGNVSMDFTAYGTSNTDKFNFYSFAGGSYRGMFSIRPSATISGVQNSLSVTSANTGGSPSLEAVGGDSNINLALSSKGTGSISFNGTTTFVTSTGLVSSQTGFVSPEFSAGTGAPGTINWSSGQNQTRTLTSSGSITLSNPVNGATYKLRVVQGGSGSYTITWPTIKWAGGVAPTLSTAVGAEDIVTLYYNGTSYYGQVATGFA